MNIAIIGYGKMGHEIEQILLERGHHISAIIHIDNIAELSKIHPDTTDVAIEFTSPESAYYNIKSLIRQGIKVVSGSTGWLDRMPEIKEIMQQKDATFFYASNYSLGVNITFRLNEILAKMMEGKGYKVSLDEIHHIHKLDSPSGTGITLAEGIINNNYEYSYWEEGDSDDEKSLSIYSKREGKVPGTHTVTYSSPEDSITLKHTAHSRRGFALGAVLVAEWIENKSGFLNMDDYFNFSV